MQNAVGPGHLRDRIFVEGSWLVQSPLFFGEAGVMACLPSKKIAIAVAVTFDEAAFDSTGGYSNSGQDITHAIGSYLAPDDPLPSKP